MRLVGLAIIVWMATSLAGEAAPLAAGSGLGSVVVRDGVSIEPVCSGCGCRGGPGYRLPSGKCASRRR